MVYCSLVLFSLIAKSYELCCTHVLLWLLSAVSDHIPSYAFHSLAGDGGDKDPNGCEQPQFVLHEQPESISLPYQSPEVSGLKSSKFIYCDVRGCDANCKEKKIAQE